LAYIRLIKMAVVRIATIFYPSRPVLIWSCPGHTILIYLTTKGPARGIVYLAVMNFLPTSRPARPGHQKYNNRYNAQRGDGYAYSAKKPKEASHNMTSPNLSSTGVYQ
jgi:hypothetical protein